jgi:hypothetical protein
MFRILVVDWCSNDIHEILWKSGVEHAQHTNLINGQNKIKCRRYVINIDKVILTEMEKNITDNIFTYKQKCIKVSHNNIQLWPSWEVNIHNY